MRFTTTYKHLIGMMSEIESLRNKRSILAFVNNSKFDDFYKHNKIKADTVMEKVRNLEKEYLEFDEQGVVKKDDAGAPCVQEGKTLEELSKKTEEIIMQTVEVIV